MERSQALARPVDTPDAATLARLFAARYSCRAFRPGSVDRAIVERIVEIAQMSASWCNSQAWQLIVTSGAGTERFRQALLEDASGPARKEESFDLPPPERYEGVYLERRRECGWALYESVGVARGDREGSMRQFLENFRLFGAPHTAIVTTPRTLGVYGAVDCGAFVSSFMLAAQSLGVATIAQAAVASRAPLVRRHFAIPDDRAVLCGIAFGYADEAHPANAFRTRREDVGRVIEWVDA
ncbi:MAG: nitroreductase [Burkholderiales bacterium]